MTTLYAINLRTFGLSRYTGLDPVAVVEHDGTTYVASATALKTFSGTQDGTTPITATVQTGQVNFGSMHDKNIPRFFALLSRTGRLLLTATATRFGDAQTEAYKIPHRDDETGLETVQRVKLGRGHRGIWWQFKLQNTNGADFAIKQMTCSPTIMNLKG